MKRVLLPILLICLYSKGLHAAGWDFNYSGLVGLYYGVSETKNLHNTGSNLPNREVFRTDIKTSLDYFFSNSHKLGLHANSAVIFKDEDKSMPHGDWRFYPYLLDKSAYGEVSLGYTFNAAYQLHQGPRDITFLGINDSNLTYFLTNPNWSNSKSSTKFTTPKSTAIMDDGRAPKVMYISPELGNTKLGFSYAPDNANRRGMVSRYADYETPEDGYAGGMQNKWQLGDNILYTSLGYGVFNRTDKELSLGLSVMSGNLNYAFGYKKAYVDGHRNPITTVSSNLQTPALFDNYRESEAWSASIGYTWEKYKTNLAYLNTKADNTRNQDNLWIFSNVYNLNKHLEVYLMGLYLDSHGATQYSSQNNKGYGVLSGLGFRF